MAQQHRVGSVHTTVRQKDGVLSVVYHQTEVVRASPTTITLDSGGYRTATTKTRMNQASNQYGLGFTVFQRRHGWFVGLGDGSEIPFADGMELARGRS